MRGVRPHPNPLLGKERELERTMRRPVRVLSGKGNKFISHVVTIMDEIGGGIYCWTLSRRERTRVGLSLSGRGY